MSFLSDLLSAIFRPTPRPMLPPEIVRASPPVPVTMWDTAREHHLPSGVFIADPDARASALRLLDQGWHFDVTHPNIGTRCVTLVDQDQNSVAFRYCNPTHAALAIAMENILQEVDKHHRIA